MKYLEILGTKYPISFTGWAWQQSGGRFGEITDLAKKIDEEPVPDKMQDMSDLIALAVEAAQRALSFAGLDPGPKLPCQPLDVMDLPEMIDATALVFAAIRADTKREVEATPPKN